MSLEFNFKHEFGDFRLEARASISDHDVTAVFGPSGSGKTRLLRLIAGLDRSAQSELSFKGEVWQSNSEWLPPHKRGVGYVFQQANLFRHLDVLGNLNFASKRAAPNHAGLNLDDIITMFDLDDLLSRPVASLSGGQQQRVAIARALCSRPRLLLMDEPLSALDGESKKRIFPYLDSLCAESGIPIIYVSHSTREVARLASSMLLLNQGRIHAQGTVDELLNDVNVPGRAEHDIDNIIRATVSRHEPEYGLSILDAGLGDISVAILDKPIASKVRLVLSARDISLTLERQRATSILNIFAAKIESLQALDQAQMLVRLKANDTYLLAKITQKSAHNLELQQGLEVYCQAKTVSLL